MSVVIDFSLIVLIAVSMLAFLRKPLNAAFLVGALNAFFLLFPILLFRLFDPEFLGYAFRLLHVGRLPSAYDTEVAWATFISFGWLIGGILGEYLRLMPPSGRQVRTAQQSTFGASRVASILLLCATIALYASVTSDSGYSLLELVTPSRKPDLKGSAYIEVAIVSTAIFVACARLLALRRFDIYVFAGLLVSLAIAAGTAQRRNVIMIVLIFAFSAILARGLQVPDKRDLSRSIQKWVNSKVLFVLALSSLLGPVLWAARNFFTQSLAGVSANPFAVRSFLEMFFGSAATGLPTFVMSYELVERDGAPWLYSLYFLLTAPVPRAMWPDKPLAPNYLLIEHFNLDFSPSVFLVADLYLNFWVLAPAVAVVAGWLTTRASYYLFWRCIEEYYSGSHFSVAFGMVLALYAANLITLFKNGMAVFLVNLLSWGFVAFVVHTLIVRMRRTSLSARPPTELARAGAPHDRAAERWRR